MNCTAMYFQTPCNMPEYKHLIHNPLGGLLTYRNIYVAPLVVYPYTDAWGRPQSVSYTPSSTIRYLSSGNSPVVNGKLVLQTNNLSQRNWEMATPVKTLSYNPPSVYQPGTLPKLLSLKAGGGSYPSTFDVELSNKLIEEIGSNTANVNLGVESLFVKDKILILAAILKRVANPLRGLRDALKYIGHDLTKNPLGKQVAGKWLSYKYGIGQDLQLLHEISSNGMVLPRPSVITKVSKKYREEYEGEYPPGPIFDSYGCNVYAKHTYRQVVAMRGKMEIEYRWTLDENQFAANALGLSDPASIIWEAVPFSFVIDWFLPIGSWISGFNTLKNVEFVKGYKLIKKHNTIVTETIVTATKFATFPGGTARTGDFRKDRTILTSMPSVSLPIPTIHKLFSLDKLVTSLALIRQLR